MNKPTRAPFMKKGSTHFLRFTIFLFGIIALSVCIFVLPNSFKGGSEEVPAVAHSMLIITVILYATVIPFFIALWQTLKLLRYIDQNVAFSISSVTVLRKIKYSALTMTALYLACVPFLLPIAQLDDAPGLVLLGIVLACSPLVIAVFAAVLQTLLQNAIDIKSENDLTI